MKVNISTIPLKINNYEVRTELFEGAPHLVVPVVILTEGVHCGSLGCKLYLNEELKKLPQAWNGRPLPVFHPEDLSGNAISANSPDVIQARSVGFLFNMEFTDKLQGEVWINIEKAKAISPDTLKLIEERKPLEVSTGMWSADDETPGTFNGESYDAVTRGIMPDHLALLPGGTGACSYVDGCGIRNNQAEAEKYLTEHSTAFSKKPLLSNEMLELIVKEANLDNRTITVDEKAFLRLQQIVENELSHSDIRQRLQREIDKLDNPMRIHFVIDVFDGFFIYRAEPRQDGGETRLFRQSYSVSNDDQIELGEEVQEVREEVSFVELSKKKEVQNNMSTKPCCPKKVDALIANEASPYAEAHKELLLVLTEEQLADLEPKDPDVTANESAAEIQALKDQVKDLETNQDNGEALNALKEEIDTLKNDESTVQGKALFETNKAAMIKAIVANENADYTEDDLKAMAFPALQKLAKLCKIPDYSNNAVPAQLEDEGEEAMTAPTQNELDEKRKERAAKK